MAGKNLFNSIKAVQPRYNRFDLTHDKKFSLNMGDLVPICYQEAIPGDKWTIGCQSLIRFMPLIAPVMHRFDITMHYFFVPYRILWPNWEKWITHGGAGILDLEEPLPAFPTVNMNGTRWTKYSLADCLGIPNPDGPGTTPSVTEKISMMPFAAYQRIWNEFYRDENLTDDDKGILVDGDNTAAFDIFFKLMRQRAWEHDYFTSCLPFAQKGPSVDIPIGGFDDVPLRYNSNSINPQLATSPSGTIGVLGEVAQGPDVDPGELYAQTSDMDNVTSNINDLRKAYALQRYFEKLARGGSRFKEFIKSMWNVDTGDARVDRPEYITGIKSPVVISEILNTTGTTDLPQGNMAGHGIGVTKGKYGKYYVREHGCIMGLMSILPKTAYQQGIDRHWYKTDDPTQYFTPDFANIGEQEVQNRELFAFQAPGIGEQTFGYLPRYAEYKYASSAVFGELRDTLSYWTASRIFNEAPQLNADFIQCTTDNRQFAVTGATEQHLVAHVLNDMSVARMMPKYGTPTF